MLAGGAREDGDSFRRNPEDGERKVATVAERGTGEASILLLRKNVITR